MVSPPRTFALKKASRANRHEADPGNIMQPPGTKVDQAGTETLRAWYQ
eukprot:COSAG02_NODE_63995_length_261_cov_1.895062_1_plen_47_part_01